jgi:SAM-dependent methyltransferase
MDPTGTDVSRRLGLGIRSSLRRWRHRRNPPRSRDELQDYWRAPDSENTPDRYLDGQERSEFLLELVRVHVDPDARILELGCNVGRNLAHLHASGYTSLSGVDINADALAILRGEHPELAADATLVAGPAEEVIPSFADGQFEMVFTMAVLEHLHPDSDWVIDDLTRIANSVLITIEDESSTHWRVYARNYRRIIERSGKMTQVEERSCANVPGLGPAFTARVFRSTDTARS